MARPLVHCLCSLLLSIAALNDYETVRLFSSEDMEILTVAVIKRCCGLPHASVMDTCFYFS